MITITSALLMNISPIMIIASTSSDGSGFFLFIVILAICCGVCYSKGINKGYARRKREENNAKERYDYKTSQLSHLEHHVYAIEAFRKNCCEWLYKFGPGRMSGKAAFEKMNIHASSIIDAVEKDISENKFSFSVKVFSENLESEKQNFLQWYKDEKAKAQASIEAEQSKIETLSKRAMEAQEVVRLKFAEAKDVAVKELEEDINKTLKSALQTHPNNAYIATVLSSLQEAIVDRTIESVKKEYDRQAHITATKAIDSIRKKFNERARQWFFDSTYYKYQTLLYESLFPQLLEYATLSESIPELIPAKDEKFFERDWLSDEEYAQLSETEKSERALEKYIKAEKSLWQIGRDYELYIGYLYRSDGWGVEQFGAERKLEDMGRDLICRRTRYDSSSSFSNDLFNTYDEILVVQCKFWSSQKIIHEKHIAQLFGTTVEYAMSLGAPYIDGNGHLTSCIRPVFVTSASLSDTAKRFASALSVEIRENQSFDPRDPASFPRIKCNKGKDGERIYHLPFDQQYDVTKIDSWNPEECWAFTVKEAESKGYRRAMRWAGDQSGEG